MRKTLLLHVFAVLVLALTFAVLPASAQVPPAWAENFNLPGLNGTVNAMAETADAFFYGGNFSSVGTVVARNLVRVDKATGTVSPLGTAAQNGTDAEVDALIVNGTDIYAGGRFTSVSSATQNTTPANRIARWDITTGTWSVLGSSAQNGAGSTVYTLLLNGTDLYVGGNFSTVSSSSQNAISAKYIAKWDTVANIWSPLGSAAQNGASLTVYALALSGSDLHVGGSFNAVSSSTQNAISAKSVAKWDIVGEAWSALGSATQNGANSAVYALAVSGADLYAGGPFTTVSSSTQNAISAKYVAKWDIAGSTWSPLGSTTQNGADSVVYAFAVNGTDLYVGGQFTHVSSSTQNAMSARGIAKWDTAAGAWSPLGNATLNGTSGSVNALMVSGTDLHVGGSFSAAAGIYGSSGVVKWSVAGNAWVLAVPTSGGDGISGVVNAIADAGTVVYVGGNFTFAGNVAASNIACWNKATHTWSALGSEAQNGTNGAVNCLQMIGTDLYAGGSFTSVSSGTQNAIGANRIVKWDAVGGTWSPLGSAVQNGADNSVSAMAVIGSGLYVGGSFNGVNSATQTGISARSIARWDAAGGVWSPLGSAAQNGVNGGIGRQVKALAANGTDLYIGGNFTNASSGTQNNIITQYVAKWNTVGGTWSPLGATTSNGTAGVVNALAVIGTRLFAGGVFFSVKSSTQPSLAVNEIAQWNITQNTWSLLGTGTQNGVSHDVLAMAVSGTDLYVGGQFGLASSATQNGITVNTIAKWDSVGGIWSPLGSATQNGMGYVPTTKAIAASGTDVCVGGSFGNVSSSTQNAVSSSRFAIYGSTPQILVQQAAGVALVDGSANIGFGSLRAGSAGAPVIFTIRNPGTADLTLGAISQDGANPGDFAVSAPGSPTVAPGSSATFAVTFTPSAPGARGSAIHLPSNVNGTANPFDITLSGTGLTALESWRFTYFGTVSNTGMAANAADPYHTGVQNLAVFAVLGPNQDPAKVATTLLPQAQITGGNYAISFTQPAGVSGVAYGAEWRADLSAGNWQAVTDIVSGTTHTFSVPIGVNAQIFMRLTVSSP